MKLWPDVLRTAYGLLAEGWSQGTGTREEPDAGCCLMRALWDGYFQHGGTEEGWPAFKTFIRATLPPPWTNPCAWNDAPERKKEEVLGFVSALERLLLVLEGQPAGSRS